MIRFLRNSTHFSIFVLFFHFFFINSYETIPELWNLIAADERRSTNSASWYKLRQKMYLKIEQNKEKIYQNDDFISNSCFAIWNSFPNDPNDIVFLSCERKGGSKILRDHGHANAMWYLLSTSYLFWSIKKLRFNISHLFSI